MFRFLRNLFSKKSPQSQTATISGATLSTHGSQPMIQPQARPVESASGVARVETAQLQLLAIMLKFPEDLKKLVLKMPPESSMVVMPIPAILRFLPTGSVKMSLASVVRQAPQGTFTTINPQDKRLVDVPLAEIFKRVSPAILKRRDDQRFSDLAADGFDLFGDDENPYAVAPRVEDLVPPPPPAPVAAPQPRVLQMPPGVVTAAPPGVPMPVATPRVATARVMPPAPVAPVARPAMPPPAAPATPPSADDQPPLVVALKDILAGWPEPIKSEAASLNGVTVALPSGQVSAGLAKGKVAFSWGQIRSWLNPPHGGPTQAAESTELLLPLRVIAPAFLKHTKGGGIRKAAAAIDEIPELFAGRAPARPAPAPVAPPAPAPEPTPAPAAEVPTPAPAPEPVSEAPSLEAPAPEPAEAEAAPVVEDKAPVETEAAAEAPAVESEAEASSEPAPDADGGSSPQNRRARRKAAQAAAAAAAQSDPEIPTSLFGPAKTVEPEPAVEAAPVETTPATDVGETPAVEAEAKAEVQPDVTEAPKEEAPAAEAPAAEPESVPAAEAPAPTAAPLPTSLAEVFNEPGKEHWSPSEIVNRLAQLPEIAGSVVALQEGLVIAHQLPEPLKGEVFAAFLPQIFARINQYSNEMKLGAVDDLLINAHGLPCHIFRIGQVYFAALGQSGATLPTHVLRLCSVALAS